MWWIPAALSVVSDSARKKEEYNTEQSNLAMKAAEYDSEAYRGTKTSPFAFKRRSQSWAPAAMAAFDEYNSWMDKEASRGLANAWTSYLSGRKADAGVPDVQAGPTAAGEPEMMQLGKLSPREDIPTGGPVMRSVGARAASSSPWAAEAAGPVRRDAVTNAPSGYPAGTRDLPTNGNGWTSLWGPAPGDDMTEEEKIEYAKRGYRIPGWGN